MSNFLKAWLPTALLLLSGNAAAFDVQRLNSGLSLRDATWLSGAGAWDAGMCTGLIEYKDQIFTGGGCVSVALYDNIDQRMIDRRNEVRGWDIPNAYAPWCMDGSNAVANTGGVNFGYDWAFGDTGKDSAYLVLGGIRKLTQAEREELPDAPTLKKSTQFRLWFTNKDAQYDSSLEDAFLTVIRYGVGPSGRTDPQGALTVLDPDVGGQEAYAKSRETFFYP